MAWIETFDNEGEICYVNDYRQEVIYLLPQATKHHYDKNKVFTMHEAEKIEHETRPSEDIRAGSNLAIVFYIDVYAEFGYNYLGSTFDENNIPNNYEVYEIYHAFCAKKGYYDYADYPIDAIDGVRQEWYDEIDFYKRGGYHAY